MGIFRSENNRIYIDTDYIEFYIPMDWFSDTKRLATDLGSVIDVFGVFTVGLFTKSRETPEFKTMALPSVIHINVYESEERMMELPGEPYEVPVKVLIYYKDQDLMMGSSIADSLNLQNFIKLIFAGKVPQSTPYNDVFSLFMKSQITNDTMISLPAVILEAFLAVAYRDPEHLERKYATVYGKDPNASNYGYKMINNRQISQYSSTFSGMTFEDFDRMVTTAVNRTRNKTPESESPLEKIIKM